MDTHTILERQEKLAASLQAAGLEAIALNPGPSLTYMTGLHFHLSERPVVVLFLVNQPPLIVLPELETAKLQGLPYEITAFPYGEKPDTWGLAYTQALLKAGVNGRKVGVEPRQLRLLEYHLLSAGAPEATFLDAQAVIAALRAIKSPGEIALMRKAAEIAEQALIATLPQAKIGMTEREFAAELTLQLLRAGSDPQMPFMPIIASGPNSANPHATPTHRPFTPGDLVVVDWGAAYQEYFSDITRTFIIGETQPELRQIGQIVLNANTAARNFARPGVSAGQVDQAARKVIEEAGYGKFFTHRTGHGLGMEGHEEPYIRGDNQVSLQPGNSFTIEPGIYLPNYGGVRIEDDVVITETGLDCLTTLPREVIAIA